MGRRGGGERRYREGRKERIGEIRGRWWIGKEKGLFAIKWTLSTVSFLPQDPGQGNDGRRKVVFFKKKNGKRNNKKVSQK